MARSSSGPGRSPLKAKTGVRLPYGLPTRVGALFRSAEDHVDWERFELLSNSDETGLTARRGIPESAWEDG